MQPPFNSAKWIWTNEQRRNHYVLFLKTIPLPEEPCCGLRIHITASHNYELYVNGHFISRGPVHGDPKWCLYDTLEHTFHEGVHAAQIAIVVHQESGTHIHCQSPAPGGLLADVELGDERIGTDSTWKCLDLRMWRDDVAERGWAIGYCEDYDARQEPEGWAAKFFPVTTTATMPTACEVVDAEAIWDNYEPRPVPFLTREFVQPEQFQAWQAQRDGEEDIADVSAFCDDEPLVAVGGPTTFSCQSVNAALPGANAFTFDLGAEHIGFYDIELDAPEGVVLEISGAELLRDGRPWIFRKGTRYTVRYRTRAGEQHFTSFSWNGFRYIHVIVRGPTDGIRFKRIGCLERRAQLSLTAEFQTADDTLSRVFDLCRRTLEIGAQEHLIDCPTREQTQYWGDGVFIAQSLWLGFGERRYLEWYLDCFLHAPFTDGGQIWAQYPGGRNTLLDYSLIPLIGQRLYHDNTGSFYKAEATLRKALRLKAWYDYHRDDGALVTFDQAAYAKEGTVNFIDHPGLGWHNFPHPGIDREGTNCALNLFFYGFLCIAAEMADAGKATEALSLHREAEKLGDAIKATFHDGKVFHDASVDGVLSPGTSWQTNSLAVYVDLITDREARLAMETMLAGYDSLCRCSPYFHFYFLPALRKVGLEAEALELIKREWQPMLMHDATTAWEGFLGDEKDSLCHPWSTAPFLFLLGQTSSVAL